MKEKKRISVCEWLLADADRESAKEKIVGERERERKSTVAGERERVAEREKMHAVTVEIKKE